MDEVEAETRTGPGGMAVITKTGALFDLLAERGELSSSAIADEMGEPRSSIYRLLASLDNLGWVEPGSRRGTYRLGLKFIGLGSAVAHRLDVRRLALPVMEHLHTLTGETVFLCVRREWRAVCIERIDGARVQSLALRIGESLPLHAGAAPRTLLAFESEELWEQYIESDDLEVYTDSTPHQPATLVRKLESIRNDGVAVSDGDVTVGIAAVGAPIFDHRGQIAAALSISGLREVLLGDTLDASRLVTEAAADISANLGYLPAGRTHLHVSH
jgi:DNA-binding IclR family transcriptional regulator